MGQKPFFDNYQSLMPYKKFEPQNESCPILTKLGMASPIGYTTSQKKFH